MCFLSTGYIVGQRWDGCTGFHLAWRWPDHIDHSVRRIAIASVMSNEMERDMKFRFWLASLTLTIAASAPTLSAAQVFGPGQFRLGPFPVGCGGALTVVQPAVGDWARAVPPGPTNPPMIIIDSTFLASAPLPVQLFTYAHECGHHMVGMNENAADCWAARIGRRQGWFTPQTMQFLTQAFQWNPGDWTHAPGPARLQNIWACFLAG